MTPVPLVSIVMPVFNDEATVAAAIESALHQSLRAVEVICVDDASTDGTAAILARFCERDSRVRVITHEHTRTAMQARRTGVLAAAAAHVLFLDGDDELERDAAQRALATADETGADLVAFGVTVVEKDGRVGGAYERRLQPVHDALTGTAVLRGLFPLGARAQGQLWRHLYSTRVLRDAHALLPADLALARVNDLPLMFLVAALATAYVSIPDKLYRYHFGRGGSGHRVDSVERAVFYTSAITSVDSIHPAVDELARSCSDPTLLRDTYASVRLSIIGYVCSQLIENSDAAVLDAALAHLHSVTPAHDVVRAAVRFYPSTLSTLRFHTHRQAIGDRAVRNVLLATSVLRTGGVSAVIASQARYLRDAGFTVTVAARSTGSDTGLLPDGTGFVELTAIDRAGKLAQWSKICHDHAIDVVIDHQVLYMDAWPEFALAARAEDAATVGWLHNFVGRPVYDGNDRLTLIERCSTTLAQLVVLSPLDVAYFKLRGLDHVAHVPNPPSPLLTRSAAPAPKSSPTGRIELVWWGRLEQRTKQVSELIEVGVQLRHLGVDFHLTAIGPAWDGLTAKKFNARARRRGVGGLVEAVGPRHGAQLLAAIDAADAFVSTSIIEGYQLTIAEAQSRGLPVFMYELPWLTLVQNNDGVVSVAQGDAAGLAQQIAEVLSDPLRYRQLSTASVDAAQRELSYDFSRLYHGVVTDTLPPESSPEPTLADAKRLLGLLVFFAARSHQAARRVDSANESAWGARLWHSAAPLGRNALRQLPGLQPLAHRAKKWLGVR
ncbi:glycosyltransferase [Microbacterium sp. KR10-403]|uniref:glycosyltransferase n=1 Tax=Microbacterium sp. KR10-403 TaxID=3158581 RepID=UPI0032E408A1